jgi:hypothetical protein
MYHRTLRIRDGYGIELYKKVEIRLREPIDFHNRKIDHLVGVVASCEEEERTTPGGRTYEVIPRFNFVSNWDHNKWLNELKGEDKKTVEVTIDVKNLQYIGFFDEQKAMRDKAIKADRIFRQNRNRYPGLT